MLELLNWYNEFAKENPIVASAFGVGLGGWALMMLRSTPANIFNFIRSRIVTTLVLNNSNDNGYTSILFMRWFNEKSGWGHLSRNFALEVRSSDHTDLDFVSGFGLNFFIFKRRLFWFRKIKLDSAGTYYEKFEITLNMFGRDQQILRDLVEEFKYRRNTEMLTVHVYQHGWGEKHVIRKRKRQSVIVNDDVTKMVFGKIDDFLKDRDWYYDRGLPYKLCFMFSGIPGTGKTSLSKVIGSEYNRDVYTLSLNGMTDERLRKAVLDVPPGNIIQFEDFDTNGAVKSRTLKPLNEVESAELRKAQEEITIHDLDSAEFQDGMVIQTLLNCDVDVTRITIASLNDSTGHHYYYWDKYCDHPDIDYVATCIDQNYTQAVHERALDTVLHFAILHNRDQGGNDQSGNQGKLSLSGILNSLDGIIPLDDQIIILSANHAETLDPALVRKGRIDYNIVLGELKDPEIRKYIEVMFPGQHVPDDIKFKPIVGCNLQAIFYEFKRDGDGFVNAIPKEI